MTHTSTTRADRCWVGIDTHAAFHVIAVIDDHGEMITHRTITTAPASITAATAWIAALPGLVGVGIEGSSSYGAALSKAFQQHHPTTPLVEVTAPNRMVRRRRGKSDLIDAVQAADAARTSQRTAPVKDVVTLPLLRTAHDARTLAVSQKTQWGNWIIAALRSNGRTHTGHLTVAQVKALLTDPDLGRAASQWLSLHRDITAYTATIRDFITTHAPALATHPGVGPDSAARLLIAAGANPERLTTDAAFAHLAGVDPIPASSGKTQRHRLNRGGDRSANNALYTIARTRYDTLRDDRTRAYITRRLAEGKTRRDIIRSLKRYIARELLEDLKTATHHIAANT